MIVNHKAKIAGYNKDVWFSKDAITNIISLRNLIKQYKVTYDSNEESFICHREDFGKKNLEFRMHESGLHFYEPCQEDFAFVNTVSDNLEGFT